MKKSYTLLLLLAILFPTSTVLSQTITLIDEDFESGIAGWNTTGNAVTNQWIVNTCAGNGPSAPGSQSAYITKGGATPGCGSNGDIQYAYENASSGTPEFTILYTTVDATCASNLEFTVDYQLVGEGYPGTPPTILDYGEIVYSTNGGASWTSITSEFYNIPTWTTATVSIPATLNGQTFEFGILWQVDQSTINDPPLAIDNLIVTGEDNIAPTLSCISDYTVPVDGSCNYVIPDFTSASPEYTGTVSATDNCSAPGNITITQNPTPGFALSGHNTVQTVTITAEDENGNISNCTFDVTLIDDVAPTFTGCPTDQTESLDGNCEASIKDYTNNITLTGDNCTGIGSINVVQVPAPGTIVSGHNEIRTIKLYVGDQAGNIDSCDFDVTYVDDTPPTILCPPNTNDFLNSSCQLTLDDYTGDATPADNCTSSGSLILTQNPAPGSNINGAGNNVITITATDVVGNFAQCTFNLTSVDTLAPSINCPGPQTQAANGSCQAQINDYTGSILLSDNCSANPNITLTQVPAPGVNVTGPSLPVKIYAEDESGNIDSCEFTLTLTDNINPVVNCPADFDVYADASCDYDIEDYSSLVTVSDNCTPSGSITITQSPAIGATISNHGTTQVVTIDAEDASSNLDQCQFTITVQDTLAPTVSCPGTQNGVVNASCQFTIPDYTGSASATDNCSAPGTLVFSQSPAPGTNVIAGTHTITITATDQQGNMGQCTFDLDVADNIAPTFTTCPGSTDIPGDANCEVTLPDLSPLVLATDNCTPTGNITYTQSPAIGAVISSTTVVSVTAMDNAGNTSICNITVNIIDTTAPTINCPANQTITASSAACDYVIPNYTGLAQVGDNCVGFASITITQSPVTGATGSGITTVTLTAEDPSGNSNSCTFDIEPIDNTPPTISSCASNQTEYANFNCEYELEDFTGLVTASDACSAVTLSQSPAVGTILNEGNNTITVSVEDQDGNISTCDFTVQVVDTLAPMLSCPSDFTSCDTIVSYPMPTAIDGCSPTITINQIDGTGLSSGDDFDLGSYTLEYEAVDDEGNSSTCSFDIEVIQGPSAPDAGMDIDLCNITDTVMNANSPAFGSGEWIRINGNGTPVDTYDPNTDLNGLSVGANTFIWSITLGQCPPRNDTVVFTVFENPTVADIPELFETCEDSLALPGNEDLIGTGYWEFIGDEATLADSTQYNSYMYNFDNDSLQMVWHIDNGVCPETNDTMNFIYYINDLIADAGPDQDLCDTIQSIQMNADTTQDGLGTWTVISGVGGVVDENGATTRVTNMNRDATTVYEWTVEHPVCGITTDRVTITVSSCVPFDFDIPTGFTPDNDGVNDTWQIPQLDKYYPNCSVTVVNRWGNLVYESPVGYDDPWDGRYKGKILPVGSYYFVINFNQEGVEPLTGTVTIIK